MQKVIIIDIAPKGVDKNELDERLEEVESLVSTYGSLVVVKRVQKRDSPDYNTYIGSGKLEELKNIGEELGVDLIIIGNILKPAQIWKINEQLRKSKSDIRAWDRVDLILKIFGLHASSPEARLQIELASIKHMGPRIFGMGMELSRQGGGSKLARGIGETNTEIMKRHLRERESRIISKLETYEKTRFEHRKSRKRKDLKTVGIVGYTNAGKSSLMNALTSKGVLSEDKLFATLGTSVGNMYVGNEDGTGKNILINDTIGFIRDLPPDLIKAFSSTLEDSIESNLLLHVVDANDRKIEEKIQIVDDILAKIGANQEKIYVFNKIDLLNEEQINELKIKFSYLNPIFISAGKGENIDDLKRKITNIL